jgi:hypothetical protein
MSSKLLVENILLVCKGNKHVGIWTLEALTVKVWI